MATGLVEGRGAAFDGVCETHAAAAEGTDYGAELFMELAGGGGLRTGADNAEYVRVCDHRGRELMYWHEDEFQEDFPSVMGAVLALACEVLRHNGLPVEGGQGEVFLPLACGLSVRCVVYPAEVAYVRLCGGDGAEAGRWEAAAFIESFAATAAAFFLAACRDCTYHENGAKQIKCARCYERWKVESGYDGMGVAVERADVLR